MNQHLVRICILLVALALWGQTPALGALDLKQARIDVHDPPPTRISRTYYDGLPFERFTFSFEKIIPKDHEISRVTIENNLVKIQFLDAVFSKGFKSERVDPSQQKCAKSIEFNAPYLNREAGAAGDGHGDNVVANIELTKKHCEIASWRQGRNYYIDFIIKPIVGFRKPAPVTASPERGGKVVIPFDVASGWTVKLGEASSLVITEPGDQRNLKFEEPELDSNNTVAVPFSVLPDARHGKHFLEGSLAYQLFSVQDNIPLVWRRAIVYLEIESTAPPVEGREQSVRAVDDIEVTEKTPGAAGRRIENSETQRVETATLNAERDTALNLEIENLKERVAKLEKTKTEPGKSVTDVEIQKLAARVAKLESQSQGGQELATSTELQDLAKRVAKLENEKPATDPEIRELAKRIATLENEEKATAPSSVEEVKERIKSLEEGITRWIGALRKEIRESKADQRQLEERDDLQELKSQAHKALSDGRWGEAGRIFKKIEEIEPEDVEARFLLAQSLYYNNELSFAESTLRDLFKKTGYLSHYYWLGKLHVVNRKYEEGARILGLVAETGQDYDFDAEIWYFLGTSYAALRQKEKAVEYFEKCRKECPDQADRDHAGDYVEAYRNSVAGKTNSASGAFRKFGKPINISGLEMYDPQGNTKKIAEFSGKILLLHFWSTSCAPCRYELPTLNSFNNEILPKYGEGDIVLLTISLDGEEDRQKATSYFQQSNFSMPIYFDPTGTMLKYFTGQGIPRTVVVNRSGVAVAESPEQNWMNPNLHREIADFLIDS